MIFVAAGTQDGREITARLLAENYQVLASVVSSYGKILLESHDHLLVNDTPLDLPALKKVLIQHKIRVFVDATHPYAVNVSENAMTACRELQIPFIRYEREESELPDYNRLFLVKNYEEAAEKAAALGQNIFLTTGSRNLAVLKHAIALRDCRLIARVLPETTVIAECLELGFTPRDIVALQGPFSTALNEELYKKYEADVILTKNSGSVGGTDTKLTAAINLGLPVVVVDRPRLSYPQATSSYEAVLAFVRKYMTNEGF